MNSALGGPNRRLLFQSYLTVVGGLLAFAFILDLGFSLLTPDDNRESRRWLESNFRLIESRLATVPEDRRAADAAEISDELGFGVRLLSPDEVFLNSVGTQAQAPLIDGEGNASYLHDAASIDAIILLGPFPQQPFAILLGLLPPLFYVSVFVVVSLWLRPLFRDIAIISSEADRFAADFREPLRTASRTKHLRSLAGNLDAMASKLSSVLRSHKELIAALSHEMRTPLARIRFALALGNDESAERIHDRLRSVEADVEQIDELIASMLDFARLDHPDNPMTWQAIAGQEWIESIAARISSERIRLELRAGSLTTPVNMDPRLMEMAVSNLLVNAMRYARNRVRCSLGEHGQSWRLTVDDDGPGVPDQEREAVFRAFTRTDNSRSRDTGGCGLGLAVVARVAELHGGRASVERSETLGGARFIVLWPRKL